MIASTASQTATPENAKTKWCSNVSLILFAEFSRLIHPAAKSLSVSRVRVSHGRLTPARFGARRGGRYSVR